MSGLLFPILFGILVFLAGAGLGVLSALKSARKRGLVLRKPWGRRGPHSPE